MRNNLHTTHCKVSRFVFSRRKIARLSIHPPALYLFRDLPMLDKQSLPPHPFFLATDFLSLAFCALVPSTAIAVWMPDPRHWWFPFPTQRVILLACLPAPALVRFFFLANST